MRLYKLLTIFVLSAIFVILPEAIAQNFYNYDIDDKWLILFFVLIFSGVFFIFRKIQLRKNSSWSCKINE
jgi:hypothetical protein